MLERRVRTAGRLFLLVLVIFALRMGYLQTVQYQSLLGASVSNFLQAVPTEAPRGEVYDRHGRPLIENEASYNLRLFTPGDDERLREIVTMVAERLERDEQELLSKVQRDLQLVYSYQPVTVVEDLSLGDLAWFKRRSEEYPELFIDEHSWQRRYVRGESAAHITGYVGRISQAELESRVDQGYLPFDTVGKSGIEKSRESQLRGEKGLLRLRVDRDLQFEEFFERRPPSMGTSLQLTLDAELQSYAHELLGSRAGVVALASVKKGEILALASSPSYDPNDFYDEAGQERIRSQLTDQENKPFYNRAIAGAYPPGSVFKPVVAQAGLQEDLITTDELYEDEGYIEVGDRRFHSWKEGGHGTVDFYGAMAESVDTYFYELGMELGVERIARYARLFGYGEKTGIDLPAEVAGLVPTPSWKRSHYETEHDRQWYHGDTVNLSIGQGYLTATPMQALWMTSLIANDGSVRPPRLVMARLDGGDKTFEEPGPEREPPLTSRDLNEVQRAMRQVITDEDGTAKSLQSMPVSVAGKTGTSQTGEDREDHAWFTAYFPFDDPEYSLVVFLEHGGSGGEEAVPLAGRVIRRTAELDPLGALGSAGNGGD